MKICFVCGARPNFMKIAAIVRAADQQGDVERRIVHTGQHYDERMYKILFDQLGLPKPDVDLEVGSGSHAVQTAEILKRFEPILLEDRPDLVLVVGDTNSTVACALAASKLRIPVAHVEAGLRSHDRDMPEEINRIITDSISDLLFVSEPSGMTHLEAEGIPTENCFFVGNVMIDTLLEHRERAEASPVLERVEVEAGKYAALTLHRPSNVDDSQQLARLFEAIEQIAENYPVVFPVHPRTLARLESTPLGKKLQQHEAMRLVEPLGYLDFLKLMAHARLVLTDSGGIQEETTVLQVPCLTLRENTERPATVDHGTNQVVGTNPQNILEGFREIEANPDKAYEVPEKWDGHAGERIFEILQRPGILELQR